MLSENLFHILFIVVFGLGFATAAIHRSVASAKAGDISTKRQIEGEGPPIFFALRLGGLVMWGSCLVYVFAPRLMDWSQLALPGWLRLAAAIAALIALPPLGIGAARAIGKNVTRTVAIREDHRLVTSGPYRYIRHPLYTMGLLLFGSLSVIAANWFMMLGVVLAFVLVSLRLPKEEAALIAAFGDEYRAYMRRTGRFLPRLHT